MNRLPLWLSIVAMVIAVAALSLALLLPGPQGPKGDTGPQGIQGIQGPPSSLSVQRQVAWLRVGASGGMTSTPCSIDLNAGDVLQGYVSGNFSHVDYRVYITHDLDSSHYLQVNLGSGQGGTTFCCVAEATGRYYLSVFYVDQSSIPNYHPLPVDEYVPVVYWISSSSERQ
jgi:hypothetical protein